MDKIRWDRVGMAVLVVLLVLLNTLSQNYVAILSNVIAGIYMMLYYREEDRCDKAKVMVVKLVTVLVREGIFEQDDDGGNDGDTKTYP
jgi:hypothetical protein